MPDLAAAYKSLIGHDPFEDDPSLTPAQVAAILIEYLTERFIEEQS